MNRPVSVQILGYILLLMGISAIGGVIPFVTSNELLIAPEFLTHSSKTTIWMISFCAVIYSIATLFASYAVLRMKKWAPKAYLAFVLSICIYIVNFLYLIRIPTPIFLGVIFFLVAGGVIYWGWLVIVRNFKALEKNAI